MEFNQEFINELNSFIVRAKSATYVGDGKPIQPHRPGSHDLEYQQDDFHYLDSYFGGSDFIGQEVVYYRGEPVWAMNYYGRILAPEDISAEQAGQMIKRSLSRMYQEGRFLGGYEYAFQELAYYDSNQGEASAFEGREWITKNGTKVYQLVYHGGLIKA